MPLPFKPLVAGLLIGLALQPQSALAQKQLPREFMPPPFDKYVEQRVRELSGSAWQEGITAENWPARQASMRKELGRMLGLEPLPKRTPLQPVVTGTVEGDGFVVEKLHYQSSPGLYVTANLYRPKTVEKPLPAVLYVCGHSNGVVDGVRTGNKAPYQHHGIWFARNGYVCLVIDTIQLGEIAGDHHGTHRLGRWWWVSRGYTPAGVEAWNGIRALDYLETRPEVDPSRLGVTGRSGGGAYSWWIAALDERVKVAVPTAGITTLHNHVVDGAIEGHCDCMFMVNTERWDFDRVAALVAPRPLLIANTDSDEIFPLDGVTEIFNRTRALYRRLGKEQNVGLHIAEGPHKDTQPLHTGAVHWLNRFLKDGDRMEMLEVKMKPEIALKELKVFADLPADEKVTTVGEFFVPSFSAETFSRTKNEWVTLREGFLRALRADSFRAWPQGDNGRPVHVDKRTFNKHGLVVRELELTTESAIQLPLWIVQRADRMGVRKNPVVMHVLDDLSFERFRGALDPNVDIGEAISADLHAALAGGDEGIAFFCPRGTGPTGWKELPERKRIHLSRRLQLLGETLESGQTWDIYQAIEWFYSGDAGAPPLVVRAERDMAAHTLYASLFSGGLQQLELEHLPPSHRGGPTYLNVLQHLDIPQALAIASERTKIRVVTSSPEIWQPSIELAEDLGAERGRIDIQKPSPAETSSQ